MGELLYVFPAYAALANGIAAHVLDFDDTHTDSITHGSAVLVPLVIALTEDLNLNSREMLAAYVTGWEIAARVGLTAKGTSAQTRFSFNSHCWHLWCSQRGGFITEFIANSLRACTRSGRQSSIRDC